VSLAPFRSEFDLVFDVFVGFGEAGLLGAQFEQAA
jgi:hypothetical protein